MLFDITRVTGQNPDANYDYQLDLEIPDLIPRLTAIRQQVEACRERLLASSSKASAMTNNLERIALELQELIDKPSKIPLSLPDVSNNLTNPQYLRHLPGREMPLALDYIEILPPGERAANPHATIWRKSASPCKTSWPPSKRTITPWPPAKPARIPASPWSSGSAGARNGARSSRSASTRISPRKPACRSTSTSCPPAA